MSGAGRKTPEKQPQGPIALNHGKLHKLYHEAQRRIQQKQPIIKHTAPKSLLLPAPNNVIFELFNTVVKEWPTERLVEFINQSLRDYLDINWSNKIAQQVIARLRREQAIDIRSGLTNIPLIRRSTLGLTTKSPIAKKSPPAQAPTSPSSVSKQSTASQQQRSPPLNYNEKKLNKVVAINQIFEHVMWRVRSDNVTQITSLLVKLVIDDGYKRGKLKAETYDDIVSCFQDWRAEKLIKLYAFGNAPANDQRLILSATTSGDLTRWVANYIDGSEKRNNPDMIRTLAAALRDRTKNCFYLTHDIDDAIRSYDTGALRSVLIVDRLQQYNSIQTLPEFKSKIEGLISQGKIFVVSSLNCVEFAPDPTADNCC